MACTPVVTLIFNEPSYQSEKRFLVVQTRVTRLAYEKIARNVAQPIFVKINAQLQARKKQAKLLGNC
jgi:hypothetical protein